MATREDFLNWTEHPVTKDLKNQIRKDIQNMQEMLMGCDEYDLKGLQGRCAACLNFLDISYESLYE
jgi:hypothetical protein